MFGGSGSIKLARIFGIRVGIDWSLLLALFLIIVSLSSYYDDLFPDESTKAFALGTASAILFFTSILLHEFGHALEARRSGIGIAGIDLWLFGGVAKMERDTRSPGEEFRVSAAGPLVSFLLGIGFYVGAMAAGGSGEAGDSIFFSNGGQNELTAVLGYLSFINFMLLGFNLIPAFPLDGGRLARAAAWKLTGDRNKATRFAATVGQGLAYVMIGLGIFLFFTTGDGFSGIWLALIGWFLGSAARQARFQSVISERIDHLSIADVMDAEPVAVPDTLTLDRVWDEYFLRYRWPWFPVVDASGRFVGVLPQAVVESLPETVRHTRTVASAMAADAPGDEKSSLRISTTDSLEDALGRDGLVRLGALIAVDDDGRLRGIVTTRAVQRALQLS